jgi:hypothetical protein
MDGDARANARDDNFEAPLVNVGRPMEYANERERGKYRLQYAEKDALKMGPREEVRY